MPWSEDAYALRDHGRGGKLCFAIMWDDGVVRPLPPCMRAMRETKEALEKAGHEVIDWEAYEPVEMDTVIDAIWLADGGVRAHLDGSIRLVVASAALTRSRKTFSR